MIPFDLLAAVCTITGVLLTSKKNRACWLVNIVGAWLWIAYGLQAGSYAIIVMDTIFVALFVRGYFMWKPAGKVSQVRKESTALKTAFDDWDESENEWEAEWFEL